MDLHMTDSWVRMQNRECEEGVTIQITKSAEVAGPLNMYLYIIQDAQLNIENGRFVSAVY